jgi:carbonic anhydrase
MADPWQELLEANYRTVPAPVDEPPEHAPKAAVLACSDARVPPSVLFDQPAGSLFVVRIAGNTANPSTLASLDYAVAHLGVELLVVLGHTGCGAVAAAKERVCDGVLEPVTLPICPVVEAHPDASDDELSGHNVLAVVDAIRGHDGPAGLAVREGRVRVEGAVHDLRSGRLLPARSLVASGP